MSNFSGNDTRIQIGIESTHGTVTTPVKQLEMLSTSLGEVHNTVESSALVGAVTTPYFNIVGRKVEGDVQLEVHPDNFGMLAALALGNEPSTPAVEGTGAYEHTLVPITGGNSLKSASVLIDKKTDIFALTGMKIDTLSLEADPTSLLTSTISFIGQKETPGASLAELSNSTFIPFDFTDMKIYIGTKNTEATTLLPGVKSFSFNYANNLENDLFVADGTDYMAEIDYQMRDITFDIECLASGDLDTLRAEHYLTGEPLSLKVEFNHPEGIGTSAVQYGITLDARNVVITEAPNEISGPERLTIPLTIRTLQVGSTPAVSILVKDAVSTKYFG